MEPLIYPKLSRFCCSQNSGREFEETWRQITALWNIIFETFFLKRKNKTGKFFEELDLTHEERNFSVEGGVGGLHRVFSLLSHCMW